MRYEWEVIRGNVIALHLWGLPPSTTQRNVEEWVFSALCKYRHGWQEHCSYQVARKGINFVVFFLKKWDLYHIE